MPVFFRFSFCCMAVFVGQSVWALSLDSPLPAQVEVKKSSVNAASELIPEEKNIQLIHFKLSALQKQKIIQWMPTKFPLSGNAAFSLPHSVSLGMNGVPVLDQGEYGTCVTFANTAALDALLGKKDYISQLCPLALGRYFEKNGYWPSGWDGSLGPLVLNQMLQFGVIPKATEVSKSCAGLSEYPLHGDSPAESMSLDQYRSMSENLNQWIDWDPILTSYQRLQWEPNNAAQANAVVEKIKRDLATIPPQTDLRFTFAVLLPYRHCNVGACARYYTQRDTWALTAEIITDRDPDLGGHEMVITGYDDNAVAIDNQGHKHLGLFTLRNSWGSDVGNKGDFYMSYDFFKKFVMEVQKIIIVKEDTERNNQ